MIDGKLIRKLQLALKNNGYIVSISKNQFFSDNMDRWITVYSVKHNKKELIRTPSQLRVIKHLVAILNAIKMNDSANNLDDLINKTIIETEELLNNGTKKKET